MGTYTAFDNPLIDQIVQDHMNRIVSAVRAHLEPEAIVLRGSFSQGEGSVVVEGDRLRFLSDYELLAITPHYGHRRWLHAVAEQISADLGVETSISRVHPYNIRHNSLGNLPIGGLARPTIAMYEVQQGGRTLYGQNWLNRGPVIDPGALSIWTGLRLLLNRMAESLNFLSPVGADWDALRWINKTILSCSDALLIAHGRYHYSYAERGRRFAELVPELDAVVARSSRLPELVRRATECKLRPSLDLYPEPLPQTWSEVRQACDATLRYVVARYLGFSFDAYAEYPTLYLDRLCNRIRSSPDRSRLMARPLVQNWLMGVKLARARRPLPDRLWTNSSLPVYQIAFAVIPLTFSQAGDDTLREARRWLAKLAPLEPPRAGPQQELDYLRQCTLQVWKDFCYGMWDAI